LTYLLDTNVCVSLLRTPGESNVARGLLSCRPGDVVFCSIVKAELVYGAWRSQKADENLRQVHLFFAKFLSLPFDDAAAEIYGSVWSQLAGRGELIGPNDLMIASIALAHDLTLVTHNLAEFGRVGNLKLEDWEA
jgi:tRNA(fMet)-specific endonuclease VapC